MITFILIKKFSYASEKIIINYFNKEVQNITTHIINNTIYNLNYEKITTIKKSNSDEIISLEFNDKELQRVLYEINDRLLKEIDKYEKQSYIYEIPVGIIYNIPILTSFGTKIPIKINLLNSIDTEIQKSIKEYGINNSIIEITVIIKLNYQIILPLSNKKIEISKSIPIDTQIVQGKIPKYYGNITKSENN